MHVNNGFYRNRTVVQPTQPSHVMGSIITILPYIFYMQLISACLLQYSYCYLATTNYGGEDCIIYMYIVIYKVNRRQLDLAGRVVDEGAVHYTFSSIPGLKALAFCFNN